MEGDNDRRDGERKRKALEAVDAEHKEAEGCKRKRVTGKVEAVRSLKDGLIKPEG